MPERVIADPAAVNGVVPVTCPPGAPDDVLDRLAAAVADLDAMARTCAGWAAAERDGVIKRADRAIELLTLARGRMLAAHKADGAWSKSGDRDFEGWRGRTSGVGRGVARREIGLAEGLAELPVTEVAVEEGALRVAHARVLTDLRARASFAVRQALGSGAETELVQLARTMDAAAFAKRVAAWAAGVDSAAVEESHARVRAERYLRSYRYRGGQRIEMFMDEISAATVSAAIEAVAGKPSQDDERSREQRMLDAFVSICDGTLAEGRHRPGAQIRPHVALLVPAATWGEVTARRRQRVLGSSGGVRVGTSGACGAAKQGQAAGVGEGERAAETAASAGNAGAIGGAGVIGLAVGRGAVPLAELDDGTLVPMSELERIACDCQMTRVVMDARGVPLDVGQTERTYKRELRRAIIARDRHCRWPGCTIPASWCDVHHITWFKRGGPTSLENGIALCRFHHTTIHNEDIQIGARASGHAFRRKNGSLIGESLRDGDSLLAMLEPEGAAASKCDEAVPGGKAPPDSGDRG